MPMTDTAQSRMCAVRSLSGDIREFDGCLLGFGTSQLDTHIHPPGVLPDGLRCSGCRWTEVRIWWSNVDNCYVVGVKGVTSVAGESDRYKSWWATTADGVLEVLLATPSRKHAIGKPEGWRWLPGASYDAMDQASDVNLPIRTVLETWESDNEDYL